jgi:hypothetical protein
MAVGIGSASQATCATVSAYIVNHTMHEFQILRFHLPGYRCGEDSGGHAITERLGLLTLLVGQCGSISTTLT